MSADLLRRAAKVLRDAAADLKRTDPWLHDEDAPSPYMGSVYFDGDPQYAVVANVMWPGAEAYIALMHPLVGAALVDLLNEVADDIDESGGVVQDANTEAVIEVARAILREQP